MPSEPVKVYPGDLVYVETFGNGLLPAKYVGLSGRLDSVDGKGREGVSVKLTANRGDYRRGEVLAYMPDKIIPRSNIRTRNGHLIVTGLFAGWEFMVNVGSNGEFAVGANSHNHS